MRLTEQQQQKIKQIVNNLAGNQAEIILFGSRVDDQQKGGDIDLLISLNSTIDHPAQLSVKISAQLERALQGRKIDILLAAPNLKSLAIHAIAKNKGIRL